MQGRILFLLSILIGLYSYLIFFLGVFGLLNELSVFISLLSFAFLFSILILRPIRLSLSFLRANMLIWTLLFLSALVNLIGVLGPELSFDALWYHLTLPKIYIETESIKFIPGGLLYYSAMPRLIDLLYVPALMFGNEIYAKLIHFLFGLGTAFLTYRIASLYVNKKLSLLAALVFYSNLAVGWLSITAYIDLGRALFAALAIYFFLLYYKKKDYKYLIFSAVALGFETSSKLIGFSTLLSVALVLLMFDQKNITVRVKRTFLVVLSSILVGSPWFIFSYINTRNPIYPFFTDVYPPDFSFSMLNPLIFMQEMLNLFLFSSDPISPIYIIVLPLIFLVYKKAPKEFKILVLISAMSLLLWYFIPKNNARFIVAYLPVFSVISVYLLKSLKDVKLEKFLFAVIYFIVGLNILYRGAANLKYIPTILGYESKEEFLIKNLNFDYGDYIDVGNKVSNIVGKEKVLVYGIHNLYYIDFPFVHESYAKKDKEYKYILSRGKLSLKNKYEIIYHEGLTNTYLYEKN